MIAGRKLQIFWLYYCVSQYSVGPHPALSVRSKIRQNKTTYKSHFSTSSHPLKHLFCFEHWTLLSPAFLYKSDDKKWEGGAHVLILTLNWFIILSWASFLLKKLGQARFFLLKMYVKKQQWTKRQLLNCKKVVLYLYDYGVCTVKIS